MAENSASREQWGSRIGLILAAAGNAIGIGNLLRFPGQAANNGGGAFMIPYFVSLLVFGIPMMWIAWTIGRYGGRYGHGTLPGQFDKMWRKPFAKYIGVIGLALPLIFCLYYTYIEAWCLGYSWFSLTGNYVDSPGRVVDLSVYLQEFLGDLPTHAYFPGLTAAFTFLLITLALNIFILYRGVAGGIELLAKIAMPLLVLFCIILSVRVFTLGQINGTVWDGLSFLYTPDFSRLGDPLVWMAAAGQIFFTLSIGFGSLECYASYLSDNDDIALTGLTTASANEFVEVIFGSMIAIPAAAVFFGADRVKEIAGSGTFNIGMISMPEILRSLPGVEFFGTIWFLLLFFAAFTSSVAVAQPVVAFFQDEAKLSRKTSAMLIGIFWLLGTIPVIWFKKYGVFDEMDFWAGTVGLVVCAAIEVILFAWIFGMGPSWEELHRGAEIKVPRVFYYVIKYVTPFALIGVLIGFFYSANLTPTPKINLAVTDRHTFTGEFVNQTGPQAAAEIDRLEAAVKAAVTETGRDLSAWAEIEFDGAGGRTVTTFQGDPALQRVFNQDQFARWLELKGFTYQQKRDGQAASAPISAKATLMFEVLNTGPFIWLARIIMIAFFIVFGVIVHAIWQARSAEAAQTGGTA
ncbi:MAG: sodium-dependent transporter [Blastocatellia bacterium]|nr:sodium-dependent transporter [Blastocatellia bacterium]